ncbi:MAG: hypothetical protein ACI4W7_00425 [Candidatus Spyradenecus sp.]
MRKSFIGIALCLLAYGNAGCLMFHGAAAARQYTVPNLVPTLCPNLGLYQILLNEVALYADRQERLSAWELAVSYTFLYGLIPLGSVVLDAALFPVNASVVVFSREAGPPFTIETVAERTWRLRWTGLNYSTWHELPLVVTVRSGAVTLHTEDGFSSPNTFRLTATETQFAIGEFECDRWPVALATPHRFSILLSGTHENQCETPRLLPPSAPANTDAPESWRRLISFATLTLTLSEDFAGEITLGETAILLRGHLSQK